MKFVDNLLNKLNMYQLLMYGLVLLSAEYFLLAALNLVGVNLLNVFVTFVVIVISSIATHFVFQKIFAFPAHFESSIITFLILFLTLAPLEFLTSWHDNLILAFVCALAISSKFILSFNRVHIWNPAVFALFIHAYLLDGANTWYVGGKYFFIPVCIFAFLILRKQKLLNYFYVFLATSFVVYNLSAYVTGNFEISMLLGFFISTPIIFFGGVMFSEPSTWPNKKIHKYIYSVLVAVLSNLPFHFSYNKLMIYNSPELGLFLGNIYSYFTSWKKRYILSFVSKQEIAKNTVEFTFKSDMKVDHVDGQYGELTLEHTQPDKRGIRRYITIASSHVDNFVRFGVRIPETLDKTSSFKKSLLNMREGDTLYFGGLDGEFTLDNSKHKNIVCIAGGIGITPFISWFRDEENFKKYNFTIFYLNKKIVDVAYMNILKNAEAAGVKIVNVFSEDKEGACGVGSDEFCFFTEDLLKKHKAILLDSDYFISGPPGLVDACDTMLLKNGVKNKNIHTDFFPGY